MKQIKAIIICTLLLFLFIQIHPSPATTAQPVVPGTNLHQMIVTLSAESPREAWIQLKNASIVEGEVVLNSHELAHVVGNSLYTQYGAVEAMQVCDPTFAYGCYHGVFEEYLLSEGPGKISTIVEECRTLVPPEKRNDPVSYSGCTHGLGHGLLTWEGLDLKRALAGCDALDIQDRPYCYDGVFMEYSFSAPPSWFDTDNLWKLCTNLDSRYFINCGRYQTNVFRTIFNFTFEETVDACMDAPDPVLKDHCIDSIGFYAAQNGRTVPTIQEMCATIGDNSYMARCITAAAGELIFQEYESWRENSNALCTALTPAGESRCHERNNQIIERYER